MPTPIQIEARRLLDEELAIRRWFTWINGAGLIALDAALAGGSLGLYRLAIIASTWKDSYEAELMKVITGERDTLPERPDRVDGAAENCG